MYLKSTDYVNNSFSAQWSHCLYAVNLSLLYILMEMTFGARSLTHLPAAQRDLSEILSSNSLTSVIKHFRFETKLYRLLQRLTLFGFETVSRISASWKEISSWGFLVWALAANLPSNRVLEFLRSLAKMTRPSLNVAAAWGLKNYEVKLVTFHTWRWEDATKLRPNNIYITDKTT